MARPTKKQLDNLIPEVTITLTPVDDWKAYTPDHPMLKGRTYVGRNEAEALTHAIADAHDFFRKKVHTINVRVED